MENKLHISDVYIDICSLIFEVLQEINARKRHLHSRKKRIQLNYYSTHTTQQEKQPTTTTLAVTNSRRTLLRNVAFVRTEVSEEPRASITRVTRIGELGRTLAVTSNRRTANVFPSSQILVILIMELSFSEMSVITRATLHNFLEDDILHSHRRENLESYKNFKEVIIIIRMETRDLVRCGEGVTFGKCSGST
jgi:hypothetical protein